MNELRTLVSAAEAARGHAMLLATVVEVEGPAYRRPGARLLLSEESWLAGSVSGGCLERDIRGRGFWRTRDGRGALVSYDGSDDERQGSGCDGTVRVLLQRVHAAPYDALVVAARCLRDETCARLASVIRSRDGALPVGASAVLHDDGDFAVSELPSRAVRVLRDALAQVEVAVDTCISSAECDVFVEHIAPPPHLFVFGTAHDARSLVRFAKALGWSVSVCATDSLVARDFPEADRVLVGDVQQHVHALDACVCPLAVIMGHHYQNDLAALCALIPSRARYIGVLGARTRAARLRDDAGLSGAFAQRVHDGRLHAPVGLELGAEGPDEIALSIVAEAQAVLRQASASKRSKSGASSALPTGIAARGR